MLSISPGVRDFLIAFCVVVIVLTFAYIVLDGREISDDFARIILLVVGFFFGLPVESGKKAE